LEKILGLTFFHGIQLPVFMVFSYLR